MDAVIDSLDKAYILAWHTGALHEPGADAVVPYLRQASTWIPLYVAFAAWAVWRFRKTGIAIIAAAGASVGIADFTAAGIVKPLVGRLRPCNTAGLLGQLDLLTGCGPGLSFPSAHAANHFALAAFWAVTCFAERPFLKYTGIVWAASIALAQVYVGRHYFSDVLAGAGIGSAIGASVGYLLLHWLPDDSFSATRRGVSSAA